MCSQKRTRTPVECPVEFESVALQIQCNVLTHWANLIVAKLSLLSSLATKFTTKFIL